MTYEEWKGERKAEAERSPTVGEVIVGKVRTELRSAKRAVKKYAEAQRVFGLTAPGFSPRPRKPIKLKGAEEAIFRREYNTHYAARYKGKGIVTTYVGSYGYIIKPVDFDEFEVLDRWLIP